MNTALVETLREMTDDELKAMELFCRLTREGRADMRATMTKEAIATRLMDRPGGASEREIGVATMSTCPKSLIGDARRRLKGSDRRVVRLGDHYRIVPIIRADIQPQP